MLTCRLIQRIKDYTKKSLSWYFIYVYIRNRILHVQDKIRIQARLCNIFYVFAQILGVHVTSRNKGSFSKQEREPWERGWPVRTHGLAGRD